MSTLRTGLPEHATAKDRLIVAIDTSDYARAAQLVMMLDGHVGGFKIGGALLTAFGAPTAVGLVQGTGAKVMLDAKFHDIPEVMRAAAAAAAALRVNMFTVHASAGKSAVVAAAEGKGSSLALAVTVLTSFTGADAEVIYYRPLHDLLHDFAHLAANNGMDGLVCSPSDLSTLRKWRDTRDLLLVTPGVRPTWAQPGDQRRYTTPLEAVMLGADYLVVGRPITEPQPGIESPVDAARRIVEEIEQGLAQR